MSTSRSKIVVNSAFDINILKLILKQNWYWCVLIITFLNIGAFLYLRYTKPLYESKALIQINTENQSQEILGFKDIHQLGTLSKDIEILRSRVLFKRAISTLPIQVWHKAQGEFLTENRYGKGNFNVELLTLKDSTLYGKPIFFVIKDDEIYIELNHDNQNLSYLVGNEEIIVTPYFNIKLTINNIESFKAEGVVNKLYFQINDLHQLARSLASGVTIEPVDVNARTVEVRCVNESPLLAKDIVTALVEDFFRYYEEVKKESAEKTLEFIETQLDSLNKELSVSKDSVLYFQRRENIANKEHLGAFISDRLLELQKEEDIIKEELRVLQLVNKKINENPDGMDVYRLIPELLGKSFSGSLNEQIKELHELIIDKENLSFKVTTNNEAIKRLNNRIDLKIELINEIIALISERTEEKLAIIRENYQQVKAKHDELPEKQMELDRLMNIQNLNEKYYSLLTEKKVVYSISNASYTSDNKVLNEATVPNTPVSPKASMIYGMSIFLSIALSIGFLVLRYITFNQIYNLSDLRSLIPERIGILGSLPKVKDKMENSTLFVDKKPKSLISESFRTIRSNLSFVHRDYQTIAITSTVSGEGKTFIALNLGGIIALTGQKVLLVDVDLRKPKLHRGLGVENNYGLSNLLGGQYTLDEVILKSRIDNLDFITAGAIPPNPSEMLMSEAFEKVYEELISRYDVIIFDTPPIGLVSDGIHLLCKADISIFAFRANYSKRFYSDKLHELSKINEIKSLNIILNGVEVSGKDMVGGYGSGYYEE